MNRLPREAVGAPSLEGPKARLDGALASLIWWGAASPWHRVGTGSSLRSLPVQAILGFYDYNLQKNAHSCTKDKADHEYGCTISQIGIL